MGHAEGRRRRQVDAPGHRLQAAAGTATRSAKAPTRVAPITRSPTASPSTPGPTRRPRVPANSLPGVNGTGTCIW